MKHLPQQIGVRSLSQTVGNSNAGPGGHRGVLRFRARCRNPTLDQSPQWLLSRPPDRSQPPTTIASGSARHPYTTSGDVALTSRQSVFAPVMRTRASAVQLEASLQMALHERSSTETKQGDDCFRRHRSNQRVRRSSTEVRSTIRTLMVGNHASRSRQTGKGKSNTLPTSAGPSCRSARWHRRRRPGCSESEVEREFAAVLRGRFELPVRKSHEDRSCDCD